MSTEITQDQILDAIRNVYDPEISIDIVELGLIYNVDISGSHVNVLMTLTSAWCPSANEIPEWVKMEVLGVPGVTSVDVEVTFTPEWGPDRISEAGQLELGIF